MWGSCGEKLSGLWFDSSDGRSIPGESIRQLRSSKGFEHLARYSVNALSKNLRSSFIETPVGAGRNPLEFSAADRRSQVCSSDWNLVDYFGAQRSSFSAISRPWADSRAAGVSGAA